MSIARLRQDPVEGVSEGFLIPPSVVLEKLERICFANLVHHLHISHLMVVVRVRQVVPLFDISHHAATHAYVLTLLLLGLLELHEAGSAPLLIAFDHLLLAAVQRNFEGHLGWSFMHHGSHLLRRLLLQAFEVLLLLLLLLDLFLNCLGRDDDRRFLISG